jgi:hypothetical protein
LTPKVFAELENGNLNVIGIEDVSSVHDIAYAGNGIFGVEIAQDAHLSIKEGRALTLSLPFAPIVSVATNQENSKEFTVVDYVNGLVIRHQCFNHHLVKYVYYAHRNHPSVFVQEIQIKNYRDQLVDLNLIVPRIVGDWDSSTSQNVKIQRNSKIIEHQVVTGSIPSPNSNKIRVVSIVYRNLPRVLTLRKRGNTNLNVLMTINYSKLVAKDAFGETKEIVEKSAIDAMKKVLEEHHESSEDALLGFRRQHTKIWNTLWQTGFYISQSKAENALNGELVDIWRTFFIQRRLQVIKSTRHSTTFSLTTGRMNSRNRSRRNARIKSHMT